MNNADLELSARARGASPAVLAVPGLALMVAIFFIRWEALPYFALSFESFGRFPDLFWPRRYELLVHITGGMIALAAGPVQIWLGLTRRHPGWHRLLGKIYLSGVFLGATAAFYLAFTTPLPSLTYRFGLFWLAVVWMLTTGLAWLAVRRRRFDQHRDWMLRSYVVTFAFVIFRAGDLLLEKSGIGTELERAALLAWMAWVVPLVLAEPLIQWRHLARHPRPQVSGGYHAG